MKKLLLLTFALALCGGCVDFIRTQNDWVKTYGANGKQISGPSATVLGGLVTVRTGTVDMGIESSAEEPATVAGNSILSKTGLDKLNAAYSSERGATNTLKTIGYDTAGFSTDVSTNAAPTVEAVGGAVGEVLKKSTGNPL